MRCSKCGRLPHNEAPIWALSCCCEAKGVFPCQTCPKAEDMLFGKCSCDKHIAWKASLPMDAMIVAIRSDKLVGEGSCSSIDECYSDEEIAEDLCRYGISTPAAAVKWARDGEGLFLEQGLNCRWGEDDDPQLKAYNEFKEAEKDNPPSRHDGLGLVWDEEE